MTTNILRQQQVTPLDNQNARRPTISRVLASFFAYASNLDRLGIGLLRLGLVIVLFWIGGLKFVSYEAESIVPLVANSPFMSFFYHYHAPAYRAHMAKEGESSVANRQWHEATHSYAFSDGLGTVIILIGLGIALHPLLPKIAVGGSLVLILMSFTTLSFLVTTPDAWVHGFGGTARGFPYLSGVDRLVVKDVIMMGVAVVTLLPIRIMGW